MIHAENRAASAPAFAPIVRVLAALGVALLGLGELTSLSDAIASSPDVTSTSATSFDYPYLSGVSGPQPSRTVDLAGSWDFETVMTTVCAGGYPVGPLQN